MKIKLIEAVRDQSVFIGMPRTFVLMAEGNPTTINASGTREQLVFGDEYVTIANGVVVAFQTVAPPTTIMIGPERETMRSIGGGG